MLPQQSAEEQEKSQSVDDAARPDMPSRLTYKKGEQPTTYPEGEENVGCNVAVEIKQAPRQEKQRDGIGKKMLEAAMHKRMGEDAEHTALLQRVNAQFGKVPVHANLQKLKHV